MANAGKNSSVAPYYGVAAVWAAWAVFFDLYRVRDFAFVAALSIGVFLFLRAVCGTRAAESGEPPKEAEKTDGGEELDKMISDGEKAICEMRRLDRAIEDEELSRGIRRLEAVCQKIFDHVRAEPSKLPQIRRFMDYYLPTTLKLLNAYDRMDAAGVSGDNITGTKEKVEKIMGTIVAAFEKQLDNLFSADALDISTDITVLETMLAQEGLTGGDLEPQSARNAGGADIELEL